MSIQTDFWTVFEESEAWKSIVERLRVQMDRNIKTIRANVRVGGKEVETAYTAGCADTIEWMSALPKQFKRELVERTKDAVRS